MDKKKIKQNIVESEKAIEVYENMLLRGSQYPKAQIKENIHYFTGRKNAFEYVLKTDYPGEK